MGFYCCRHHAVIGELPSLEDLNTIINWQMNLQQLSEVAYDYYRHQTQIQEEDFRGQVKSLIDLVWGVDVASEELIQLGVNYIENGGSWSEGLLALSLHDNHRQQMENDLGELQLHQKYSISETGWSADVSDDQLFGGYGDDILVGGFGSDLLDGGKGEDIAVQLGNSYDHLFRISSQGQLELFHQTSLWGIDTLIDIEKISFGDQIIDSDCSNMSGEALMTAAALHQLMFDEAPTLSDLNAYTNMAADSLEMATELLNTNAGSVTWGAMGNRQFVSELCDKVLDEPLSESSLDYLQGELDQGNLSRAESFILCLGVNDYQDNLFVGDGMLLG